MTSLEHSKSVLIIDDFEPYLNSSAADLRAKLPDREIFEESNFARAKLRILELKPEVMVLDLHGPNGEAEGLELLKQLIEQDCCPQRIIINSGEHAREIRDAFARSLQLINDQGDRVVNSCAIVVIAKHKEDLPSTCRSIELLEPGSTAQLIGLKESISSTLRNHSKTDRSNAYLAAELDQFAAIFSTACREVVQELDKAGLSKYAMRSYIHMYTPKGETLERESFSKEFSYKNSIRSSRHFYHNIVRWIYDATVYDRFIDAIKDNQQIHTSVKKLCKLCEDFLDKLDNSRSLVGYSLASIDGFPSWLIDERLASQIEFINFENNIQIFASRSIGRALAEICRNSLKAYGLIKGPEIDESKLGPERIVRLEASRIQDTTDPETAKHINKLQLKQNEFAVRIRISDKAGGLKIPLEQALKEGVSTFGTSGSGMTEVCEILNNNRSSFSFSSSKQGFTTDIYLPAIDKD